MVMSTPGEEPVERDKTWLGRIAPINAAVKFSPPSLSLEINFRPVQMNSKSISRSSAENNSWFHQANRRIDGNQLDVHFAKSYSFV